MAGLQGAPETPRYRMQNLFVYMFLEECIQSIDDVAKTVTYTKTFNV